jgi:hypothetical protein
MSVKILTDHLKEVSSVYSGRHGCASGCRGNHTSNPRTIRQIVGKIQQACDQGYELMIWPGVFFAIETDTRHYIAYTDGRIDGK